MTHETGDVRQVIERIEAAQALTIGMALAARDSRSRPLTEQEADELTAAYQAGIDALADAEQQLSVLRPGGRFAWKDRADKAEAEIERLKAALDEERKDGDETVDRLMSAEAETARLTSALLDERERVERAEAKLAAQPAPSGWQQRIAAALTAKATHGVLQGPWNDQKREPAILLQDAIEAVVACGQNAVDALPPEPEVKEKTGITVSSEQFGRIWERAVAGPDAKDAIPPGAEGATAKEQR